MSRPRASLESLLGSGAVDTLRQVGGDEGIPLALPATEDELLEVVKLAASEGWSILPVGLGSKLSWRNPFPHAHLALSTRRLSGVVSYEPGDGTLTARAGTTMADLEHVAREGGNHLTPRVPAPGRATLGGVLAAGQSGIDRSRYGPSRHHVLGMRVALADGSMARSGGRLVKNVTGYDMHRLYCGSRGTLCVILEASMRLFAGFEREILLSAPAPDRTSAIAGAALVAKLELQPLCVRAENVIDPGGGWRVHVLLAGRETVVEWTRQRVLSVLPGAAARTEHVERVRDAELDGASWADLRISGRPSILARALADLGAGVRMVVEPSIAAADLFLGRTDPAPIAREMRTSGLEVHVRGSRLEPARTPAAVAKIEARLKAALDPRGAFV